VCEWGAAGAAAARDAGFVSVFIDVVGLCTKAF